MGVSPVSEIDGVRGLLRYIRADDPEAASEPVPHYLDWWRIHALSGLPSRTTGSWWLSELKATTEMREAHPEWDWKPRDLAFWARWRAGMAKFVRGHGRGVVRTIGVGMSAEAHRGGVAGT